MAKKCSSRFVWQNFQLGCLVIYQQAPFVFSYRFSNPSDNQYALNSPFMSKPIGGQMTQINGIPLSSKAIASSIIWESTNCIFKTETSWCQFSHSMRCSTEDLACFPILWPITRVSKIQRKMKSWLEGVQNQQPKLPGLYIFLKLPILEVQVLLLYYKITHKNQKKVISDNYD